MDCCISSPAHLPAVLGEFPRVGLIDAFTGVNGDSLPVYNPALWAAMTGVSNFEIQSNAAQPLAAGTLWGNRCLGVTYPHNFDQTWQLAGASLPAVDNKVCGILVCAKETDNIATTDGYFLGIHRSAGTNFVVLYRMVNGNFTTTIAAATPVLAIGDELGVRKVGSDFNLYHKPAAGVWTLLASGSDTTFALGGLAMISSVGSTLAIDTLQGGGL